MPKGIRPKSDVDARPFRFGVYIGRFQPYHNGHHRNLSLALAQAEKVIVVLGSARCSQSIKNPWTVAEREQMIRACFSPSEGDRLVFASVRDYLYSESAWFVEVQEKVRQITGGEKSVCLVGHFKDRSNYYLKSFPQWRLVEVDYFEALDATAIRTLYFGRHEAKSVAATVPAQVLKFLGEFTGQSRFSGLCEEFRFLKEYRKRWEAAPFPVTFTTTDAVVIKSGHVLVVRRKHSPGKGLIALPGGFLGANEPILESCLRELKEETSIGVPKDALRDLASTSRDNWQVFDHPDRSLRGRTITHAFLINLGKTGELPRVKGGDDADHAWWLPISDVYYREDEFYEDHAEIVKHFLGRI